MDIGTISIDYDLTERLPRGRQARRSCIPVAAQLCAFAERR